MVDRTYIFTEAQEIRNDRALAVYNRVQHKLTGRDFNPDVELTVPAQVEKLISQATSLENLCQSFSGWLVSSFFSFKVIFAEEELALIDVTPNRCAFW